MRIGNTELEYGLCLAPMAGYTDRAMRIVAHKFGAEYSVSEMISAKAVVFGDKKTHKLAEISADEGKVALQIFGSEPDVMAEAAAMLEGGERGFCKPVAIDINMGCPVHKIFSSGDGSALMRSPDLIYRIVEATSGATKLPVTVKLRLGIDERSINVSECAIAAESGGAAAVCIHGRTRTQMYSGEASYEKIAEVVGAVKIPVIANGDITNAEKALRVLKSTGAAAIAIGRGAVGNPFLFSEIRAAFSGGVYTPPTLIERVDTALMQLKLAVTFNGEEIAVREARKQIALYLSGFRGAAAVRAKINTATTYAEAEAALRSLFE